MKRMLILSAIMVLTMILSGDVLAKQNDEGFIYGKVITRSGDEYYGIMRWGKQEYFWDDLFNATKEKNQWLNHVDKKKDRRPDIRVFGKIINIPYAGTHQFVTRFGDIQNIDTRRGDDAIIKMKNGSEYKVSGYGDVGATLLILDQMLGKVKLKWDNIDNIEFAATPKTVNKPGYRLYGKVETRVMEFEGWVMWDAEECISSDVLDGETTDGDMEIEFGNIRAIERRSSSSSNVILKDGREYVLRGTNDVDDDNRGIYVEDKRYGKVEIPWDEFDKVTYIEKDESGDPYDIYKPTGRLKGAVDIYRIGEVKGEIVFDLDENEGFEILDGKIDDIDFYIPMRQILSITPKGRHSSKVKLINGEELILEDTQDVSASNDGVLIFKGKDDPEYYDWDEIEEIRFDHK
ncbi:MAG: hypothetical protein H8E46_11650 [FCB group bacterium]|nr:hypothetical protein [FCB group bacterium]